MNYIELEAVEFKQHLEKENTPFLVDVREAYEFEETNIGGINIPMGEVLSSINDLKDNQSVYLCCRSGKRSKAIALHLIKHLEHCQVYSMKGGITAYQAL